MYYEFITFQYFKKKRENKVLFLDIIFLMKLKIIRRQKTTIT